jgi:putative transposase
MAVRVIQVRILPSSHQASLLKETAERCNSAANHASRLAWQHGVFRRFALHKLAYREIRAAGLGAQATVRAISRVCDTYANRRACRSRPHVFRPFSAVSYDARMLSFFTSRREISIWTVDGRERIPYVGRHRDLATLETRRIGECDLIHRGGKWLLQCSVSFPDPEIVRPTGFIGVDLGIKQLAVTSDGSVLPEKTSTDTIQGNAHVRSLRERRERQRRRLQSKDTAAARRRLRRMARREARFMSHVNHKISKRVVREAERTERGISLENLEGFRDRIRASRSQRRILHTWSFRQLRRFIEYKAAMAGVPLIAVDPAYTSQTCPRCGHIAKANRPHRDSFRCVRCGHAGPADHIAALNIAVRGEERWGAVDRPHAV